ncbi:hypothetical protein GCM10027047_26090 [Rhodococcus aerolatus]
MPSTVQARARASRTTVRTAVLAAVAALLGLLLAAPGAAAAAGSPIATRYAELGGPGGPLGFQVLPELPLAGGSGAVYLSGFSLDGVHAITWSAATGAHTAQGAILLAWVQQGPGTGPLGYATDDEHPVAGGRAQDFEHGTLVVDDATGRVSTLAPDGQVVVGLPVPYSGDAGQVVTVTAAPGSSAATLQAFRRDGPGWVSVIGPVAAQVGPTGIGQASESVPTTPAGVYGLSQAFGRQPAPTGTALPYFRTDALDWWDENPASPTYNTHVRQVASPGGASENLYLSGAVYGYAVVMDYNTARVPGAGSAFFIHVTNGAPTAGCVAVPAADVVALLQFLDPAQHPVVDLATT